MKNRLLILIAALALTAAAAGCGKTGSVANDKNPQTETADVSDNYAEGAHKNVDMDKIDGKELDDIDDENDSAVLEESKISIEDAVLTTADDRNVIIVSYEFTNKSDNEESFNSIIKSDAYQDGTSVAHAVIRQDIKGYEPNSAAERIKPGKTIEVQEAFYLANDTSPVTISVREFHSNSGVTVSKTFSLQ